MDEIETLETILNGEVSPKANLKRIEMERLRITAALHLIPLAAIKRLAEAEEAIVRLEAKVAELTVYVDDLLAHR